MKQEGKKTVNFNIDENKSKLLNAIAMKQGMTVAKFLESLFDSYIAEHKEEAERIINAFELDIAI
jgi:hypothetical protein